MFGTDHDGSAMVVGTADKNHLVSGSPQVPDKEISRHVGPEVAEVAGTIGIGKPAGHEDGSLTHYYAF